MPILKEKYPPDWKDISRRIRFVRANSKCERCGAVHGSTIVRVWRDGTAHNTKIILTTAHLNRDTMDNREENLAALCQKCHLLYDRFQHAHSRKYGRGDITTNMFSHQKETTNGI